MPATAQRLIDERRRWQTERAALLARASQPVARVSPSKLAHETEPREPVGDGRERAMEFGVIVHEALERMDATGLPDDARAMVERALKSDLLARAGKAAEVYRELPFSVGTMDGKIDLLFREGRRWVLVDYKTDVRPEPELYRAQLQAYADALKEIAGIEVADLVLFFVATGQQVKL
jgi:ATP-dependent exoDNAse (exonuclease V) beta subunit